VDARDQEGRRTPEGKRVSEWRAVTTTVPRRRTCERMTVLERQTMLEKREDGALEGHGGAGCARQVDRAQEELRETVLEGKAA